MITPIMTEVLKGDQWGDGQVFRPDRFLDADGNVVKNKHQIADFCFLLKSGGNLACGQVTLANNPVQ